MQTDIHKALAPFNVNSHRKCTSLAAIAKYIAISYKMDYRQITFLQRSKLLWSLTKPQFCLYFT